MPISINTTAMSYKSPTTEQYVDINAVGGAEALTILSLLAPSYENLPFPVLKGQHCVHGDVYYVANSNIQTYESWNPLHWDAKVIGEEITELQERKVNVAYECAFTLEANSGDSDVTRTDSVSWSHDLGPNFTNNARVIGYNVSDSSMVKNLTYTINANSVSVSAKLRPGAENIIVRLLISEVTV